MKTTIRTILLFLPLLLFQGLQAQQLPIYSQYMMNGFMINPAEAGHDGYTSFNATARQQWLGFKDAPQTYSASWQTRLFRRSYKIKPNPFTKKNMLIPSTKGRVGLGAYVINDRNANVARTGLSFAYAYHIILKDKQLSFGLALKAFQYRIFTEHLTFGESGDPVINSDQVRRVAYSPDADFGVLLHGPKYFTGLAISNLLESAVMVGGNEIPDFKTYRHYWLMGGYEFQVSREVEIEPSVLLKTTENWNPQGDVSVRVYYDDLFWGGVSYRTNQSLILLLGVRFESIYFGYAFDWALSEIGHFNYGSHEITLSVKLGDNARRYRWLNRY